MELLLSIDRTLFFTVNQLPHTLFFDRVALFLSFVGGTALVWIALAAILFFREERKDHWFIAPCAIAGIGSWLLSTVFLKSLFGRVRPIVLEGTVLVGPALDSYSFPSSHATIAFAFALVLSREEPKGRWLFFVLAILISLSRIYLGVHYPLDVTAGAFLGLAIGYTATELTNAMKARLKKRT